MIKNAFPSPGFAHRKTGDELSEAAQSECSKLFMMYRTRSKMEYWIVPHW